MRIDATFVRSAAAADDFPSALSLSKGGRAVEIALVGRSNVGKSSVINALVRRRVARTSAAPGKTRLANIYRVEREGAPVVYFVDLPGYGFAKGAGHRQFADVAHLAFERRPAALLLVDARHPGLESDLSAWRWLHETIGDAAAIAATKIDKLARGQRIRAVRKLESVFEHPVLAVSAVTGEGLEELWKAIDNLANINRRRSPHSSLHAEATAPPHRKNSNE